jgi:hypothetical protein
MKPAIGCCMFLVMSGVAMALQVGVQAQGNAATAEREVRATMERCLSAYGANDLNPYFACFADDMTLWRGDRGRFWQPSPKQVYMEGQADFVKQSGGYQSCKAIDMTVQLSPAADSAVTTYELDCLLKPRAEYHRAVQARQRVENRPLQLALQGTAACGRESINVAGMRGAPCGIPLGV